MATRVPTHVPALWGPSFTVGALAFTYHACSLPLKTLALLGLGVSSGYLLMLDPNVLYTPHALSLIRPYIYTGFNTRILGAHLRIGRVSTQKRVSFLANNTTSSSKLYPVGKMSQFVVTSCRTQMARSASFILPFSKDFSFVFPSLVLREPFSSRSTSPLPNYTQIVGRLFGHFPCCATTLAICPQWMYSFTSSKPKTQVRNCG